MKRKSVILSLMLVGLIVVLVGCTTGVRGTGELVSRDFEVEDFNALDIRGGYQVTWRESDSVSVRVEMQENLFEFLQVSVADNTLSIDTTRNIFRPRNRTPRIYIYTPYLEGINFHGAVNAQNWDTIYGESFAIEGSGAINVEIQLEVVTVEVDISGAGSLDLSGNAEVANITTSGAASVSARTLQTRDTSIDLSGAGEVDVAVSDYLNVELFGAGVVRYTGSPTIERNIFGVGRLEQR